MYLIFQGCHSNISFVVTRGCHGETFRMCFKGLCPHEILAMYKTAFIRRKPRKEPFTGVEKHHFLILIYFSFTLDPQAHSLKGYRV